MSQEFSIKTKNISEYLKLAEKEKFVIPEYQRNYAWAVKHCDQLWEDIYSYFIESDKKEGKKAVYFSGTILINLENENRDFQLIDGQQRTITFILLLKSLLNKMISFWFNVEDNYKDTDKESKERMIELIKHSVQPIFELLYKTSKTPEEWYDWWKSLKSMKKSTPFVFQSNYQEILRNSSLEERDKEELQVILTDKAANETNLKNFKKKNKGRVTNYLQNFIFFNGKIEGILDEKKDLYENIKLIYKLSDFILKNVKIIEIKSQDINESVSMFNSLNSKGMPLSDVDIIYAKLYQKASKSKEKESEFKEFKENWEKLKEISKTLEKKEIIPSSALRQKNAEEKEILGDFFQQYIYIYILRAKDALENVSGFYSPSNRTYYLQDKKLLNNPQGFVEELLKVAEIWNKLTDYPIVKLSLKFNKYILFFVVSLLLVKYKINEINEDLTKQISTNFLKLFVLLEIEEKTYSASEYKGFLLKLNARMQSLSIEQIREEIEKHIKVKWKEEEIKNNIRDYKKAKLLYLYEYITCLKNKKEFKLCENTEIEHIASKSSLSTGYKMVGQNAEFSDDEYRELVENIGNKILLDKKTNVNISNKCFNEKIVGYKEHLKNECYYLQVEKLVNEYDKKNEFRQFLKQNITERSEEITADIFDFIFRK